MSESKLLSPSEVADRIGVHRNTLTNWRNAGIGPAVVRLPSGWHKYPADLFEQWFEENMTTRKQVA